MVNRKSSRRQFLRGESAADAVADLADRFGSVAESGAAGGPASGDRYFLHVGRRAMACQFEVLLNAGQHAQATEAAVAALDLVQELEAQLTVYRSDSEVMRLNRQAALAEVPLEPRLFGLLEEALRLYRETEGAFDVTAGPLAKAWGFFNRQGTVPGEVQLAEALKRVGSQRLLLDATRRTARFLAPGMEVNLGAIGKGYALDRCGECLLAAGVENFLVHAGQSSVLARGSQAGAAGWEVGVQDPLRPKRPLARLRLVDRALGTSGSGVQFFRHQGRRYGHIIDPRSGRPAQGVRSATVLAPRAAEADALSTAFYILGVEWAAAYCRKHPAYAMLMLVQASDEAPVELHHAGFAEGELTLVTATAATDRGETDG